MASWPQGFAQDIYTLGYWDKMSLGIMHDPIVQFSDARVSFVGLQVGLRAVWAFGSWNVQATCLARVRQGPQQGVCAQLKA